MARGARMSSWLPCELECSVPTATTTPAPLHTPNRAYSPPGLLTALQVLPPSLERTIVDLSPTANHAPPAVDTARRSFFAAGTVCQCTPPSGERATTPSVPT